MAIIPNKNLKDTELRDVLNKDAGKTDNVYGSKFRQSASPTIYAKYKPTRYPALFVNDDNRWLGADRYCGIEIPNGFGSDGLDVIYESEWTWAKPRGGKNEPLRFGDWRGYNPDAKTQLFQSRLEGSLKAYNGSIHLEAWVYHPNAINGHLLVTDSEKLGDFRLGVRMKEPNGYSYIMTSSKKASEVANDSGLLSIDYPIEDDGGYEATLFLTYDNYTEKTGFPTVITCYSLPKSGNYKNKATGTFVTGATATTINCYNMSDSLRGTYIPISNYGYNTPYEVNGYGSREYFELRVTCESSLSVSDRVLYLTGMTLEAKNVLGKSVSIESGADGDIMNLYDSNFNQVSSISNISTDYDNPTICYLEVVLFAKGVTTSDESSSSYGEIVETHPSGTYNLGNTSRRWGIDELYIKGV